MATSHVLLAAVALVCIFNADAASIDGYDTTYEIKTPGSGSEFVFDSQLCVTSAI